MGLTQVNSSGIEDGSIVNADIKSDAAIALTKLASTPAVLTGSTDNTITTVTGANTLQGEANLTFDGANLGITAANDTAKLEFLRTGTTIGGSINTRDESGSKGLTYTAKDGNSSAPNHVFQTDDGGGAVERVRIDSSGNVGIGTTDPDDYYSPQLVVKPSGSGGITVHTPSSNTGYLMFADGNTGADRYAGYIGYSHSNDNLILRGSGTGSKGIDIESGGSLRINDGDLVIGTSGHGIDFSATADGSGTDTSSLLNDYERGTWTPTYGQYGGATNGSISYSVQNGFYVKIGCKVQVWFDITISSWSGASGTGPAIYGLPYAKNFLDSVSYYYGGATFWQVSDAITNTQPIFTGWINDGETKFRTFGNDTPNASYYAPLNVAGRIAGSIIYTTSS